MKRLLVFLGKPFYYLLLFFVLTTFFIFEKLKNLFSRITNIKIKIYISQISFPKFNLKIKWPKKPITNKKLKLQKNYIKIINKKNYLKILTFLFLISLTISFIYFFVFYNLPKASNLKNHHPDVSTKIYDKKGKLLYTIYKDENRSLVKIDEVPLHVKLAILAAEDASFYNHFGFSIKGISRAIYKQITEGKVEGGSTITQQLIKNTLLSPEKTLRRKIRELYLAIRTEEIFSKDEILEMYLNEIGFGGTSYGIAEASETYFHKNVKDLTVAEAALIAGLIKSPTKYSPFGLFPENAIIRQKEIINLMAINGFINEDQKDEALKEKIAFAPNIQDILAPHFVMFVKDLLVNKYGEEMVERGGLEVYTTLDLDIQKMAENEIFSEIEKIKNLNVTNGAGIILNNNTGGILAMIGSKNYFDVNNDGQVNVTTRLRQPGSSIKVVTYSYALSHGMTPATIIDDSPVSFQIPGQKAYIPQNYDGKFKGKITLRQALAESRNIPAVKVLAQFGLQNIIDQGKLMGIETWDDSKNYGLSLTLGGAAVNLIDLTQVYSTLANYGKRYDVYSIDLIKNSKGETIYQSDCQKTKCRYTKALDEKVAFLITNILSDNKARSGAFGTHSALLIQNHPEVAVKTGTSNDLRDNLAMGYNQDYTVGIWVGNNDNSPMNRVASGITGASPIWNKIMTILLKNQKSIAWDIPAGLNNISYCGTNEWFISGFEPKSNCIIPIETAKENQNPAIL